MSQLTLQNLLPRVKSNVPNNLYTYVGIDFGTSTTVVSYARFNNDSDVNTETIFIKQDLPTGGHNLSDKVPTCIAYSTKRNEMYIGDGAYETRFERMLESGKNVWFEFKTLLGEDLGPIYAQSVLDGKDGKPNLETALDATTIFLKYIREQVEHELAAKNLPQNIRWAVSVPASFEANQRKDLLKALENAGIKSVGETLLIDEPNAAFLSFIEQSKRQNANIEPLYVPEEEPISLLVFDFGAGTCDISILSIGQDDQQGVFSKNIAISHYTEIGGKDVDREIADMLTEQLVPIADGTPSISDVPGRIKKRLQQQLGRIAEELKISLCKQVDFIKSTNHRNGLQDASSSLGNSPILKDDKNRQYTLPEIRLTYTQFSKIMNKYLSTGTDKSIFKPIDSALRSAGLKPDEIDYVLMVGGSAKNPWVKDTLKTYFKDAETLVAEDIQSLVSQGAALHSYYLNGLGHKLIKPITGPTIKLIMANGQTEILVPSGTEIPYEGKTIDNLRPQQEGQTKIELPICLSTEEQILQVLKIEPQNKNSFSLTDKISLSIKITADKTLHIAAKVSTGEAVVTQLNPYSSAAMNTRQKIAAVGRKKFNTAVRKNGRTAQALKDFSEALGHADERLESAETLQEAWEISSSSVNLNNLGVAWGNAGNTAKAKEIYLNAFEQGELYAGVNLAANERWTNPVLYKELLNKAFTMNPNDEWVLYNYGQMLKDEENSEWEKHWEATLKIYMDYLSRNSLKKDDVNRAITIATALKKNSELTTLKRYKATLPDEGQLFDPASTVTNIPAIHTNTNINKQQLIS